MSRKSGKLSLLDPPCFVGCDNKQVNTAAYGLSHVLEAHSFDGVVDCISGEVNSILQREILPGDAFGWKIFVMSIYAFNCNVLKQSG